MTIKQFSGGIALGILVAAAPFIITYSILCAFGRGLRWTWHEVSTTARMEVGSFGPTIREILTRIKEGR